MRWYQLCEEWISLSRRIESGLSGTSELVVLPRWPLLLVRNGLLLPAGVNQLVTLKPTHGRVDGSTGKAGHLHDAESVDIAGIDGLEDHRGGMREPGFACHGKDSTYVAGYLTSLIVVCYIGYGGMLSCSRSKTFQSGIEACRRFRTSASALRRERSWAM